MIRKLENPLQSPRRRGRFKPTALNPVIVEEENDLLNPRSPVGGATADVTVVTTPPEVDSNDNVESTDSVGEKSEATPGRYQVTSV